MANDLGLRCLAVASVVDNIESLSDEATTSHSATTALRTLFTAVVDGGSVAAQPTYTVVDGLHKTLGCPPVAVIAHQDKYQHVADAVTFIQLAWAQSRAHVAITC